MDNGEVADLTYWFTAYSKRLRMEYGQAMGLIGIHPDVIAHVQQIVAQSMVGWLTQES